ncbi:hypothetical protein WMY93_022754 [Mugilogobius chulae]|uniref:Uncharacterized protein n=1 Tax=Mugilogobius chulae TaxID=88201 RepID=A0AAW0NCC3_9GOBI
MRKQALAKKLATTIQNDVPQLQDWHGQPKEQRTIINRANAKKTGPIKTREEQVADEQIRKVNKKEELDFKTGPVPPKSQDLIKDKFVEESKTNPAIIPAPIPTVNVWDMRKQALAKKLETRPVTDPEIKTNQKVDSVDSVPKDVPQLQDWHAQPKEQRTVINRANARKKTGPIKSKEEQAADEQIRKVNEKEELDLKTAPAPQKIQESRKNKPVKDPKTNPAITPAPVPTVNVWDMRKQALAKKLATTIQNEVPQLQDWHGQPKEQRTIINRANAKKTGPIKTREEQVADEQIRKVNKKEELDFKTGPVPPKSQDLIKDKFVEESKTNPAIIPAPIPTVNVWDMRKQALAKKLETRPVTDPEIKTNQKVDLVDSVCKDVPQLQDWHAQPKEQRTVINRANARKKTGPIKSKEEQVAVEQIRKESRKNKPVQDPKTNPAITPAPAPTVNVWEMRKQALEKQRATRPATDTNNKATQTINLKESISKDVPQLLDWHAQPKEQRTIINRANARKQTGPIKTKEEQVAEEQIKKVNEKEELDLKTAPAPQKIQESRKNKPVKDPKTNPAITPATVPTVNVWDMRKQALAKKLATTIQNDVPQLQDWHGQPKEQRTIINRANAKKTGPIKTREEQVADEQIRKVNKKEELDFKTGPVPPKSQDLIKDKFVEESKTNPAIIPAPIPTVNVWDMRKQALAKKLETRPVTDPEIKTNQKVDSVDSVPKDVPQLQDWHAQPKEQRTVINRANARKKTGPIKSKEEQAADEQIRKVNEKEELDLKTAPAPPKIQESRKNKPERTQKLTLQSHQLLYQQLMFGT